MAAGAGRAQGRAVTADFVRFIQLLGMVGLLGEALFHNLISFCEEVHSTPIQSLTNH